MEHFLLPLASAIPGGLTAGGGVNGKEQAGLLIDELGDGSAFLQKLCDFLRGGPASGWFGHSAVLTTGLQSLELVSSLPICSNLSKS